MGDARISPGLPGHPKTKKLIRRLGWEAPWKLVCLHLWAASNRTDGDLSGMDAEEIELAVDWTGEPGAFVAALVAVRFLDGEEGAYKLHDWAEHQPWVNGATQRGHKARWNAVKRHHGEAEADRQVPEYAAVRVLSADVARADSNAGSTKTAKRGRATSNAPSPSPSPSPLESERPTHPPASPAVGGFSFEGAFEGQGDRPPAAPNPVAPLAIALTRAGFRVTTLNPDLVAYQAEGGTVEHLQQLVAMDEFAQKPAGYLLKAARRELAEKPSEIRLSVRGQGVALTPQQHPKSVLGIAAAERLRRGNRNG